MVKKMKDMLPHVTATHQRKRDGTPVARKVIEAPVEVQSDTTRVRFLKTLHGSRRGTFEVGQVAYLPNDVARDWAEMGLVEEDKMLSGAPETK